MSNRYILSFEINDLPKMANASGSKSTHWRYAQKEVKKWHNLVSAAVATHKPPRPIQKVKLTLTRCSSVAPDYDGLVRGFKSVVDALCLCKILENDTLEITGPWDCRWVKAPAKQGKIQITVEEIVSINHSNQERKTANGIEENKKENKKSQEI